METWKIWLKPLTLDDDNEIYDMLQDIPSGVPTTEHPCPFTNAMYKQPKSAFASWLAREKEIADGINLGELVRQSTLWLYDGSKPVGYGKLRHDLNEKTLINGGHIGYAIRDSLRGIGYGSLFVSLLFNYARNSGLKRILVTVSESNAASRRVFLKHGCIEHIKNGICYYWVDL